MDDSKKRKLSDEKQYQCKYELMDAVAVSTKHCQEQTRQGAIPEREKCIMYPTRNQVTFCS